MFTLDEEPRDVATVESPHTGAVRDLEAVRDGAVLASAGSDGTIRLHGAEGGARVNSWRAHDGEVTDLEVRSDGVLASVGADASLRLWRADRRLMDLGGHDGPIRSVAIMDGDRYAVTASADGRARVWDLLAARVVQDLGGSSGPLTFARFTGAGHIVTAGDDGYLRSYRCVACESPLSRETAITAQRALGAEPDSARPESLSLEDEDAP